MDALALDRPIATPVPASTRTGVVRMYKDTSLISRPVIFLCRYSGVRPTIRPAMNTATIATMRIPYIPVPVPPGATSPSPCLLYTSDAADEEDSVDLGGRRIIK